MNEKMKNELIAKRAKAIADARTYIKDGVTTENQSAYDKAMADVEAYSRQIDDLSKLDGIEDVVVTPIDKPVIEKHFENFLRAGNGNGLIMVHNAISSASASAGYLVPEELKKAMIEIMYEQDAMMQLADVINTNTLTDIPVDGTAPTAYWTAEEGAYTDSAPTVSRVQLGACKVTGLVKVSEELLADSAFDVETYVSRLAAQALGAACEQEFINGTVSGRPTAFLGAATLGLTTAGTGGVLCYDDLVDLYTSVKTPYAQNGAWLAARNTLGKIMKLKDSAGNFVFQPSYQSGQPDMLLGRPFKTSAKYAAGTTTSDKIISFGDFKYYKIGIRGGFAVQRLNELYAGNGQVGFRFTARVDGKLSLAEAIKYASVQ